MPAPAAGAAGAAGVCAAGAAGVCGAGVCGAGVGGWSAAIARTRPAINSTQATITQLRWTAFT